MSYQDLQHIVMHAHMEDVPGAHYRIAIKADSTQPVQVDLYNSYETARRGGIAGLICEEWDRGLTIDQKLKLSCRIAQLETQRAESERCVRQGRLAQVQGELQVLPRMADEESRDEARLGYAS